MRNPARWIAIIASVLTACAVQATTTKALHHPRERSAHATLRTVRYARQASSTTAHPSHRPTAKKSHHYAHRRYVRRSRYHRHVVLPKGPTPERITQIQSALARGGYYKGDPSGRWDPDTVAAVQKFQSANNIDATGKLDAPTLQRLGLGSDIAGVAAPRQVVPKVCCSTDEPGATKPSAAPPPTSVPGKPAGSLNPTPDAGHMQSASTSNGTNASGANGNGGGGASSASAIAPSTTSGENGTSGPASASKPAADQH